MSNGLANNKDIKLKPLRIRHIAILDDYQYNYKDFLFVKEDFESYTFYHKPTKRNITLRR